MTRADALDAARGPEAEQAVPSGVQAYQKVLKQAGGRELDCLLGGNGKSSLCAAIYASPPYDLDVPPLPVPRLSVNLTRSWVSGGIGDDRSRRFDARRYSIFLTPAHEPVRWCKESPSRHLAIYFAPGVLQADDDGLPLGAAPSLLNSQVSGIGPWADQLCMELLDPGAHRVEAADSLARLLLIRVARHLALGRAASCRLSPQMVSRLKAFVMEHAAGRILVADLAACVGMPPNRFTQAFVAQTRQSPHQFVLAMRVQRAAGLLGGSTMSLAEIADACGFASQQHLSNAMRRLLGTTPGRYRADFKAKPAA